MIQRQPAHEHIRGSNLHRLSHGLQIRQKIGVRQYHALGIPGTSRRVLQKGDVVRLHRGVDSGTTVCGQLRYRDDMVEPLNLGAEEPR